MKTYKLYMTRLTEEALNAFENEPYTRANLQYLLIYTDKMGEHNFPIVEISEDMANERLTEAESKWLLTANLLIINAELAKNAPKVIGDLNAKIDVLEKALEAEKIKLSEGAADANGE